MLLGIIKNQNNNSSYYIHLDKENDYNKLYIIETTKDTVRALNRQEAISIIKTILSSKLTYKEKYNDYDVYLDETNNKRYFKNGKENYFMFLKNNGVSAIKCYEGKNKIALNTKAYKIIASTIGFSLLFSSVTLIPIADDTRYIDGTKYALSSAIPLTSDEAVSLINTSFYLSPEEKQLFANKDYFDFVLSHTKTKDREYYLRNSLCNMTIKHYDQDFFPSATGYYNPLDINAINICKDVDPNSPNYLDVAAHEFIHLTQDQNDYLYIIEGTAEMLEYEYLNQPCDGYPEMVKRVKVLMEIIGPEPVASCIYSGDTEYFEKSIKQYLSEENADKLLELFKISTTSLYEDSNTMSVVNMKIDTLLSTMYYNKTGKQISDDLMIKYIYATNTNRRIYFNTKLEGYGKDYFIASEKVTIDKLDIEDIVDTDIVSSYTFSIREYRTVDGQSIPFYSTETTTDFHSITPIEEQIVNIDFKDGSKGLCQYDIVNDKWNTVDHFNMVKIYEPSIPKKFPDQVILPYKDKEIPKKVKSEAKLI